MTAVETTVNQQVGSGGSETRGRWTPINVAVTIVGFMIYWPLGLFFLAWIIMGRELRELPGIVQNMFSCLRSWLGRQQLPVRSVSSGNRVFDDFQQTQIDRIDEIKIEIKERDSAFRDFKEAQDRAFEQQQFEAFMKKQPGADPTAEYNKE